MARGAASMSKGRRNLRSQATGATGTSGVVVSARLDTETAERLADAAERLGAPLSQVVRDAIQAFVQREVTLKGEGDFKFLIPVASPATSHTLTALEEDTSASIEALAAGNRTWRLGSMPVARAIEVLSTRSAAR